MISESIKNSVLNLAYLHSFLLPWSLFKIYLIFWQYIFPLWIIQTSVKCSFYLYFNQELILSAHVSKITDADGADNSKVKFIDSFNAGIWSRLEKLFLSFQSILSFLKWFTCGLRSWGQPKGVFWNVDHDIVCSVFYLESGGKLRSYHMLWNGLLCVTWEYD